MRSGQIAKIRVHPTAGVLIAAMAAENTEAAIAATSKDEAVDDIKANFSFMDSNGDGGIDLAELTSILKRVSAQGGSRVQ